MAVDDPSSAPAAAGVPSVLASASNSISTKTQTVDLAAFEHPNTVTVNTQYGRIEGHVSPLNPKCTRFLGIPYAAPPKGFLRFKPPIPPTAWSTTPSHTGDNDKSPKDANSALTDTVRPCHSFGPAAPQLPQDVPCLISPVFGNFPADEDSLFVNVFSCWGKEELEDLNGTGKVAGEVQGEQEQKDTGSKTEKALAPVLVFYHGGANINAAGGLPIHDGSNMAAKGQIVVVTLNYRLNLFGFLHLGLLASSLTPNGTNVSSTSKSSPNVEQCINLGFKDQVLALKWVRDNIHYFGGDPNNITISGQSAGASAVSNLLVSPQARGLFRRAILQSLPCGFNQTEEDAREVAQIVLKMLKIGPSNIHELWERPWQEIIKAMQPTIRKRGPKAAQAFAACVEPGWIPVLPWKALMTEPPPPGIDLIVGCTRHEHRMFVEAFPRIPRTAGTRLAGWITGNDRAREEVFARYEEIYGDQFDGSPIDMVHMLISDRMFKIPAIHIAENWSRHNSTDHKARSNSLSKQTLTNNVNGEQNPHERTEPGRVYFYEFGHTSPYKKGILGSCHACDIGYMFDTLNAWDKVPILEGAVNDAASMELADKMTRAWAAFARTGDPSHSGLVTESTGSDDGGETGEESRWPPYDLEKRKTLVFEAKKTVVVQDWNGRERKLWEPYFDR
ncbi:hypothetical protein HK102_000396 [Quaeritorhiza haematococci]|nr:hypothetical protein HK102_000396 [Quaeritorhiza haematococci]